LSKAIIVLLLSTEGKRQTTSIARCSKRWFSLYILRCWGTRWIVSSV